MQIFIIFKAFVMIFFSQTIKMSSLRYSHAIDSPQFWIFPWISITTNNCCSLFFFLFRWQRSKNTSSTSTKKNICIYIVWEKVQWETGHFKMFQGRRDTLFSGKRDILPSGNDFFFLWESDHLSSGNQTTYTLGFWTSSSWETGHAILLDSDHLSSGKHYLGIGNLGIGF